LFHETPTVQPVALPLPPPPPPLGAGLLLPEQAPSAMTAVVASATNLRLTMLSPLLVGGSL
jgi:hypothetical protein